METINILIAASEEMHEETIKFSELIANLNEVLEPRGIELQRVKWNPEKNGSIDEFKRLLEESELCLTLYWQYLAGNSEKELDAAYQRLKVMLEPPLYSGRYTMQPKDQISHCSIQLDLYITGYR